MGTSARSIEKIDARTSHPICKDMLTFFKAVMSHRKNSALSCFNYDVALKYLVKFSNENDINFKSINDEWVEAFRVFLLNTSSLKNEQRLNTNSAGTYYSIVLNVVSEAIQHRLVDASAMKSIKYIKRGELKTEALSAKELSHLAEAECDCVTLKKAFLLSSLTGIQWNELKALAWKHIHKTENSYELKLAGVKDERTIPLTLQAYALLTEAKGPDEKIFENLKGNAHLYIKLNKWAIRAGVLRNITFQSARLTFARLLHEKGIPSEIIAELLGHKNVKSTIRMTQ